MKKKWNEILNDAKPLVDFLSNNNLFDKPYKDTIGAFVVRDPETEIMYATDHSNDELIDWESISDSEETFPENFEWNGTIDRRVLIDDYFGIEKKKLNGADTKWTTPTSCILKELMYRDIRILLSCYANDTFPPIWKDILTVYLNNGFPCGWKPHPLGGKLVVFSNL